jgi:hypothetical protein
MARTFHIKFPGDIILGVQLQDPHPVNLTVTFPNGGGGVKFSYSHEHGGKEELFGSAVREDGSKYQNRVRPAPARAARAVGSAANDVAIEYNDPGGSRC